MRKIIYNTKTKYLFGLGIHPHTVTSNHEQRHVLTSKGSSVLQVDSNPLYMEIMPT